jgi:hypothetical protein
MEVGVSVGGAVVEVGEMVCVGGRLEGWLLPVAGVPVAAHAASAMTMQPNKDKRDILFICISSRIIQQILYLAGSFCRIRC